jgi:uncharacterized protein (DUF2147 family)
MKKITSVLVFLLGAIAINAQSVEGLWNTGKENTIIKIKKVDNLYDGTINSSDNSNAPIGKLIVKDVEKKGGTYKGQIYVDNKKKWYNAEFIRTGNKLKVTVYSGLMNKTVEWKLVN